MIYVAFLISDISYSKALEKAIKIFEYDGINFYIWNYQDDMRVNVHGQTICVYDCTGNISPSLDTEFTGLHPLSDDESCVEDILGLHKAMTLEEMANKIETYYLDYYQMARSKTTINLVTSITGGSGKSTFAKLGSEQMKYISGQAGNARMDLMNLSVYSDGEGFSLKPLDLESVLWDLHISDQMEQNKLKDSLIEALEGFIGCDEISGFKCIEEVWRLDVYWLIEKLRVICETLKLSTLWIEVPHSYFPWVSDLIGCVDYHWFLLDTSRQESSQVLHVAREHGLIHKSSIIIEVSSRPGGNQGIDLSFDPTPHKEFYKRQLKTLLIEKLALRRKNG